MTDLADLEPIDLIEVEPDPDETTPDHAEEPEEQ
jgi:hypothetical protein